MNGRRRDGRPIAINVVVFDDNVADVDTDTKANPPILGNAVVAVDMLDFDSTMDRLNSAGELDQKAIALQLDDAAFVLANFGLDQFFLCARSALRVPASSSPMRRE